MDVLGDKLAALFESLFGKLWEWIVTPFKDLPTFKNLIFGRDRDGDLAYGIFKTDEITNIFGPGVNVFMILAIFAILIGIILGGMKVSSTGINPSNRTYVLDFFKDLIIVGLVLFNLDTLYYIIFGLNYSIINVFGSAHEELFELKDSIETGKGVIGWLIINLCLLGLTIWANFYYMMRKLTLLLLMIMGPLMVTLYLIPKTKGITWAWLKELFGTVMIQSIHAMLYWAIALLSASTTGVESVILYVIFIPVAESIRALFGLGGDMHERLNRAAAMMGGGALTGIYGAFKGALGEKSVMGAIKEAYRGFKNGKNVESSESKEEKPKGALNNVGTDVSSTAKAERMLKSGEIMSKAGKAIVGAAGAISGSPMGPMGSMMGASMGYTAGGVVGGIAGRTGALATQGLVGGLKKINSSRKDAIDKFKGVRNAENEADELIARELAEDETTKWASQNQDAFMKDLKERFPDASDSQLSQMWGNEVNAKRGEFLEKARNTVGQINRGNQPHARAEDLVNSTVDSLTNDWAERNKENFNTAYDQQNPLPANATSDDIAKHNKQKEKSWQNTIASKRKEISGVVNRVASKLSYNAPNPISFVDKEAFANEVGTSVADVLGKGSRETVQAVKQATSSVKPVSLYSGKSVNREMLLNRLAEQKTSAGMTQYINDGINSGQFQTQEEGLQQWHQVEAPKRFNENVSELASSLPRMIPLNHRIIKNPVARAVGASVIAASSFVTGASGIKEISQFVGESRVGQASKLGMMAIQEEISKPANYTQGVLSGIQEKGKSILQEGVNQFVSGYQNYTPVNAVEKQAGFRNAIAYTVGVIGGVNGYKKGAKLGMKMNPYNKAVNDQTAEMADIQHMVQTVTDERGTRILNGAIRMATTANQTVLQVRDKTGQVQTVSRITTGDSSLKKGETIYQDLTLENGHLLTASPVYKEDSGGGHVVLNRRINVDPNRLVANRNVPKSPRVVTEVQSYNQAVDSGQYYLKDAVKEMTNIKMVVDRNRSYLVGQKDGREYRISQYGPGDARLNTNEVIYRTCNVKNTRIEITGTQKQVNDEVFDYDNYTTSLTPDDLIPKIPPNKRNVARKQIEKYREKSLTEPLR